MFRFDGVTKTINVPHAFSSVDKGLIDWEVIVNELRQIGFEGFVSIEYEGDGEPESGLRSSLDYLMDLL